MPRAAAEAVAAPLGAALGAGLWHGPSSAAACSETAWSTEPWPRRRPTHSPPPTAASQPPSDLAVVDPAAPSGQGHRIAADHVYAWRSTVPDTEPRRGTAADRRGGCLVRVPRVDPWTGRGDIGLEPWAWAAHATAEGGARTPGAPASRGRVASRARRPPAEKTASVPTGRAASLAPGSWPLDFDIRRCARRTASVRPRATNERTRGLPWFRFRRRKARRAGGRGRPGGRGGSRSA